MKKITLDNTKNIRHLEFVLPERPGVCLLVGPNGSGKTTLLVCLDRICNANAFARGFSASRSFGAVDQYSDTIIKYETDDPATCLLFRKKSARWAVSSKGKSHLLLNCTPFVRQYDILSNRWGDLLCQEENQTNDIRRNSKNW